MIVASFLKDLASLGFWWNYVCGMIAALFIGYGAGMVVIVASNIFSSAGSVNSRKVGALAALYAILSGVIVWLCFWKAGYSGFLVGFIFPGLFMLLQGFGGAAKAVAEGLGVDSQGDARRRH